MVDMINPKQLALNLMQQTRNPMISKLMNMSEPELYQFATNFYKEQGVDFPKVLEDFKKEVVSKGFDPLKH